MAIIDKLEFLAFSLPGIGATSQYRWYKTSHYLVVITTNDGLKGIGEGTPYLGGIISNMVCLREIRRLLVGMDLATSRERLFQLQKKMENKHFFDYGAFLASDAALVDLRSSICKASYSKILGGSKRSRIPVVGTIFLCRKKQRIKRVRDWASKELKHLKVKITGHPKIDVSLVQSIVQEMNNDVEIRVDANGGFKSLQDAIDALKVLERLGVTQIEQPFPPGHLKSNAKLRQKTQVKIYLDESLKNQKAIVDIARFKAADGIHIHPSKFGVVSRTQQIINLIQDDYGLEWSLGASGMTGIGAKFQLSFASVQESLKAPVEEIGHEEQYGLDIVRNSFVIEKGTIGLAKLTDVTLDPILFHQHAEPLWSEYRYPFQLGTMVIRRVLPPALTRPLFHGLELLLK